MDGPHRQRHSGWCSWLCTCLSISTWIWMHLCFCEDQLEGDRTVKWQMLTAKMRQVPNKSGGSDLPGKRVWRKLGSGEMAKRKCQIGASGEMSKQVGHRRERRLPLHEGSWQFETQREQVSLRPPTPPHPPPTLGILILQCCIFNVAFALPRSLALIALVIE